MLCLSHNSGSLQGVHILLSLCHMMFLYIHGHLFLLNVYIFEINIFKSKKKKTPKEEVDICENSASRHYFMLDKINTNSDTYLLIFS